MHIHATLSSLPPLEAERSGDRTTGVTNRDLPSGSRDSPPDDVERLEKDYSTADRR